jgi:transcriptional regulator with XRE-family HTH domain
MKNGNVVNLVGVRVRSLRRSKGLTQKELAEKSGLHLKLIRGIERGEADLSVEDLKKISGALGIEIIDLVRGKDEGGDPDVIKRELLKVINQIQDKEKLELLLEILRALK